MSEGNIQKAYIPQSGDLVEKIRLNAAMVFTNATIGEKSEVLSHLNDWSSEFGKIYIDETNDLEKHLDYARFGKHSEKLCDHYSALMNVCAQHILDIEAAFFHLGQMGYHGAYVLAEREVAKSKIENSKQLVKKLQGGRNASPRARRKKFALQLYAQHRDKTVTAHEAAHRLKEEIFQNATALGDPLSVDRGFETIYEWFRDYDKEHPRKQ